MQVTYQRCAGLDVHKKTVVACVLVTSEDGEVHKQVRTFLTMTSDLLALSDWLDSFGVTHVALESTGVYWRPVFNLLEEGHTLLLVNPRHMKAVPGRKTDVKDSEWIADLLRHGLLQPSFLPPKPIRELRELVRYRKTLVQERTQEINRLQKILEDANIKLAAVATDIVGKSGRDMLQALISGEQDAELLAELARGRLRAKLPALRKALEGRVQPHHRFLLERMLTHIEFLEESILEVQKEIEQRLPPFEEAITLLQSIPGIHLLAASAILAEIGCDMSRFPSAKHLASWAGVCPGNKQSGGKRLSSKITKGNPYLRAVLAEVVWAIAHTKDNYLSAHYHRLARRLGKQKAVVAVSHSVLVIIYRILYTMKPYNDLGADYFDRLDADRVERHHVRRLEQLGYAVTLTPKDAA
ncbi:MAG TPA: IS110 family transposase [Ktedonobacteraceae bacterium]|nr:IS110 family transposase [Ktedonobacteraceae bacterium]